MRYLRFSILDDEKAGFLLTTFSFYITKSSEEKALKKLWDEVSDLAVDYWIIIYLIFGQTDV